MNDIGPDAQVLRAAIVCALVLPTLVIGIAWFRVSRLLSTVARGQVGSVVILILLTCSQGLLLAELVASDLFGPDYGSRRYATILLNLALMVATASTAALLGGPLRRLLVCSSVWVAGSWLYMLAVSSVV